MSTDLLVLFMVSLLAGGIASISGFGIGSILTPLMALRVDLQLAVAAVSIPHLLATALRFILIREHLNKDIFINFGIWSAVGGLAGAILHNTANNPVLVLVFASLLIFAGGSGITGLSERMRFPKQVAWLAGIASGAFGGLVGNQGGIRSAALLGFELNKAQFVATATAIGLLVDFARMPVYFWRSFHELGQLWLPISVSCAGVLLGTLTGKSLLGKIPERIFKRIVAALILTLGISVLLSTFHQ